MEKAIEERIKEIKGEIKHLEEEFENFTRLGLLSSEEKSELEQKILELRVSLCSISIRSKPLPSVEDEEWSLPLGNRIDWSNFDDANSSYELPNSNKVNKSVIKVYCPKCGHGFDHEVLTNGQVTGGIGGASAGAILGGKIGLALGPFGAIAGTIPGAILGGYFGKNIGTDFDKPTCPNCSTKFQIPTSFK